MKVKLPSIVTVLVLTTLTAIMWISLSVYRAVVLKPDPTVPEAILKELNPVLDEDTINEIQSRQFISADQIQTTVIISTPTPTPSAAPTATPVESATPTDSPEASTTPTPTGGATP
ncbi:MAG: hypothetical protein ACHQUA_00010 [Microgenomates group bacterium]